MGTGVVLSILAGAMLGVFAAPMKAVRVWNWEHTWLAFSVFALAIMPLTVAMVTVPELTSVWRESGATVLLSVAGFAVLWGVGSITYGLAVRLTGIAIANAVILGLNNAIGSILPIVLYSPRRLLTTAGMGVAGGVLVMIVGILICAGAGFLRDQHRQSKRGENAPEGKALAGLLLCFASGILGASFNFALISGKPIEAIAIAHGASPSSAPNATWPVALMSGCLVAIVYCGYLMAKNRNIQTYVAAGCGINWFYAILMAALWYGGVTCYGTAVTKLGELGASIGWAVLQSMTVLAGVALGFVTGEWKMASRRIVVLLTVGVVWLIIGIVTVVYAGLLPVA